MAKDSTHEDTSISKGRFTRVAPLAGLAARTAGEAVIASLRRRHPDPEAYARRAERYVEVLGHSKGALMKAGQMLSVIPFVSGVPPENRAAFQAAMARLQADAPPMAPELAAGVVEAELRQSPEQVFAEFSAMPIAAASIGQVHVARLRDGRPVAVKVQYPGVAEAIRADLRNTELVAVFFQLLRSVAPGLTRLDPKAIAAEISERITEELDYRLEASNQTFFADAYRGHPFIHIPEVIPELSTHRVLTQELADGLSWPDALEAGQSLRNSWGEAIYRFAHGSLRRLHTFNADPHPGNYVFHLDGSVSFLDFGCVKGLKADQVTQVQNMYRATLRQDAPALLHSMIEMGIYDADRSPSPEECFDYLSDRVEMILGPQPFTVTPEFIARMLEHEYTLSGPSGRVVRSMKGPHDLVSFFPRVDIGVLAVLGELRATNEARGIAIEMDLEGPPATPLGEADAAYWAAKPSAT
jgi:predicted unusual protein kinase regulating ubiquinone biosynthesis (AarF/ABC1/UbiB family)